MMYRGYAKQRDWVEARLRELGYVTRNQALKLGITRLSTYIYDLKQEGWDIIGKYEVYDFNGEKYRDYKYIVRKFPKGERKNDF